MAELYADLVRRGLWELEQVPAISRDAVAPILRKEVM